jgi:hypothetical protein
MRIWGQAALLPRHHIAGNLRHCVHSVGRAARQVLQSRADLSFTLAERSTNRIVLMKPAAFVHEVALASQQL